MGYTDGPSMYQFGLNDPVNNTDPLGLEVGDIWEMFEPGSRERIENTRRESQIRARHRQTMVFLATVNPNHDPREALWRYYREGGYNAVDAAGAVGGFLGPPGLGSSSALGQFHESLAY